MKVSSMCPRWKCAWFDRDGNYKGEYADLPKLELGSYRNDSNVPVKYYGEW